MKQFNYKINGFSLIEVLIFISILSLFFVVAAAVTTASLRNMKINEHKILATRYAEEVLDWLRYKKEIDWNKFTLKNSTYCFKSLVYTSDPDADWPSQGACNLNDFIPNTIFIRQVILNNQSAPVTQVNVSITVSWSEPGGTYQVPINTVFSIWE